MKKTLTAIALTIATATAATAETDPDIQAFIDLQCMIVADIAHYAMANYQEGIDSATSVLAIAGEVPADFLNYAVLFVHQVEWAPLEDTSQGRDAAADAFAAYQHGECLRAFNSL